MYSWSKADLLLLLVFSLDQITFYHQQSSSLPLFHQFKVFIFSTNTVFPGCFFLKFLIEQSCSYFLQTFPCGQSYSCKIFCEQSCFIFLFQDIVTDNRSSFYAHFKLYETNKFTHQLKKCFSYVHIGSGSEFYSMWCCES